MRAALMITRNGTGHALRQNEARKVGLGEHTKEETEASRMSKDSSIGTASFERAYLRDPEKGSF